MNDMIQLGMNLLLLGTALLTGLWLRQISEMARGPMVILKIPPQALQQPLVIFPPHMQPKPGETIEMKYEVPKA